MINVSFLKDSMNTRVRSNDLLILSNFPKLKEQLSAQKYAVCGDVR